MIRRFLPFLMAVPLALPAVLSAAPLKVDLNMNVRRKDVLTKGWQNWQVKDGAQDAHTFGDLTVILRKSGPVGSELATSWWKSGYDTGATMVSDGVFVKGGEKGGALELVFHGLKPGKHSLVTFFNSIWKERLSSVSILVNGEMRETGIKPTVRVPDDEDAATGYIEFTAEAGKDVVVRLIPDGNGTRDQVILNGFELDVRNPARIAGKPSPGTGNEHVREDPVLTWRPAKDAVLHEVYLGTSPKAVAAALPDSPEFQGAFHRAEFITKGLNSDQTYYWRVDEIDAQHNISKGPVWSFRVRHLAFPGAQGYGRFAMGGRGGRVIEVTNLNDSGPGSLRAAVDAVGPRTVVFRVGGVIWLKSKLVIRNPYITIAGQTAPGEGIALYGYTVGCYATHDVILRYLRIRVGDRSGVTMDGSGMGVGCNNCIMDHCSISWSIDEGFSSRMGRNFTLQRTIIEEALNMSVHSHYIGTGKGHSFAGSISGDIGSFHHNLIADCAGRNWSLAGGLDKGGHFSGWLDIRNNVCYNWHHRTNDGGVKALNLVNNYYIPGKASIVFHLLMPDFGSKTDPQQYYVNGNVMEGYPQYNPDNWKNGGVRLRKQYLKAFHMTPAQAVKLIKLNKPFCVSYVKTQTAKEAYKSVMADVGANYPKYDVIDAQVIHDVLHRTNSFKGSKTGLPGIIDSQKDVGGYPELKGGPAPKDSDHDGIPDAWEVAHNLNPNNPADARRTCPDGYTNLEHYLDEIPKKS